jgi:hypothetical protein
MKFSVHYKSYQTNTRIDGGNLSPRENNRNQLYKNENVSFLRSHFYVNAFAHKFS